MKHSRIRQYYERPAGFGGSFQEMLMEYRQISTKGAEKIGEGAHGEVYRIAEDTIVKVYRPTVSMEAIRREKQLARWAFVKGLPTAISFDIVRVGELYGVVYEMLDAHSASDYIKESDANFERFVSKSVELMNQIHAVEVMPGELSDMKEKTIGWIKKLEKYLPSYACDKLMKLTEKVPASHTLLHADFHLKNILVTGDELMLIDMDTLCAGDPIFEIATLYNSYMEFPSISPMAAKFLGIDVETANRIWERTIKLYTEYTGEDEKEITRKAQILGCIRILDYADRQIGIQDREIILKTCKEDILKNL